MLEEILFLLVAFSLFMIIFSKIIRRSDSNYIALLVLESIGIAICFIEVKIGIHANAFFTILRYLLSVILPVAIIVLEIKGIVFTEILVVVASKILILFGKNKEAKQILTKFVAKYNDSYYGHRLLAEIYEQEGGMRKAIDEYVMAIDIKGNDYDSYFKIANLLKELNKKDEAIEMLKNLTKSKPDCLEASMLLGELLSEQERFKEAANVYQDALRYHSAEYDLYYSLGIVFTRLNDFSMAKEMYEKAAELNHRLYGAYYNLGQICFIEKDLDSAEKYFEKSLYGDDLEAMSYYQLAKIYVIKGQKEKAINFLNKAIEIDKTLLKKASKEKLFQNIKQYITVSVKLDEKEPEEKVLTDEDFMDPVYTKEVEEKIAQEHLEKTTTLVEDINENTVKQRVSEKVTNIINKEKLKKLLEEEEIIEANENANNLEKQENQKTDKF